MKIRLKTSTPREIAATGQLVEPGGTVDVPKALADALCDQPDVWEPVKTSKKES